MDSDFDDLFETPDPSFTTGQWLTLWAGDQVDTLRDHPGLWFIVPRPEGFDSVDVLFALKGEDPRVEMRMDGHTLLFRYRSDSVPGRALRWLRGYLLDVWGLLAFFAVLAAIVVAVSANIH